MSFAAEQFLKAASWQDSIQAVLERLGRAANASRVYLSENSMTQQASLLAREGYEWVAPGIEPQIEKSKLGDSPPSVGDFERWTETLSQNQPIHGHVREFPESERQVLALKKIQSMVIVPIFVEQAWWGLMGFDECLQEREWSTAEIDALKAAASILGAAIQRTRLHQEVEQRATEMGALYEMSTAGMTSIRLDEILTRTVAALQKVLRADCITLSLVEPDTHELVIHALTGSPSEPHLARRPIGAGVSRRGSADRAAGLDR